MGYSIGRTLYGKKKVRTSMNENTKTNGQKETKPQGAPVEQKSAEQKTKTKKYEKSRICGFFTFFRFL